MSEDQSISEGDLEQERINQFWASLRKRVHEQQRSEVAERLRTNPHPTEEELAIDAFAEEIEPQARDAVLTFYRKGYSTNSSGFYFQGKFQQIDGPFIVDEATKKQLETEGYEVTTQKPRKSLLNLRRNTPMYTAIKFYPSNPNLISDDSDEEALSELKNRWNRMAEILPDRGKPAPSSMTGGSVIFRQQYGKK